jgi:hypothetical protein
MPYKTTMAKIDATAAVIAGHLIAAYGDESLNPLKHKWIAKDAYLIAVALHNKSLEVAEHWDIAERFDDIDE